MADDGVCEQLHDEQREHDVLRLRIGIASASVTVLHETHGKNHSNNAVAAAANNQLFLIVACSRHQTFVNDERAKQDRDDGRKDYHGAV